MGVGLLLLLIAAGVAGRTGLFLLTAKTRPGKVVEIAHRRVSGSKQTLCYPMVAFEIEGRRYQFQGTSGSPVPRFKVGQAVSVLHKAGAPTQAQLRHWFGLWGSSLVLGGLGVGLCMLGLGVLAIAAQRA